MNWPLERFKDKDVVYVGIGKGRAMAGVRGFLEKHGQIASLTSIDKPANTTDLSFLRNYNPAKTVFVKNEAVPPGEMPVPFITGTQLFFELVPLTGATTIGITGTKGKSTTTALTAHILRTAGKDVVLAGNIGVSPLESLDVATSGTYFVLEMSSYQLATLTASPHISACLNIYNDHADWHGSLEAYAEAKHNVMRFAGQGDVFIYNPDFPVLRAWADAAACRTLAIDPHEPLDLSHANLFGDHNRLNALIAREIARVCGVDDATTMRAINSFEPLRHRMQIVVAKGSHTFVDDAIGMTPESTIASLRAISEKLGTIGCVLLGGQDRGYDFAPVMRLLADLQVPYLVLFPDTTEKMKAALPAGYQPEIFETRDMAAAVQFAAKHAPPNSVVVLSTAAPSYSIWRDFEEKGDLFQTAVRAL